MRRISTTLSLLLLAFLVGFQLNAQCDPHGGGNPDNPDFGSGQGSGPTDAGDLAWETLLYNQCDTPIIGLGEDYDPNEHCTNSSNLIPALKSAAHLRSVKVAIIDSGVRPDKPGRFGSSLLHSYVVSSEGVVSSGTAHPHPHGTYSAGAINGLLLMIARSPEPHEFYSYQVLDGNLRTNLTQVVAAIDDAVEKGVNVISLSIGFVPQACDNMNWQSPLHPLYAALERARQADVVVVTSAGNDGNDLALAPQYPAAYAGLNNLVSVGGLTCEQGVPAQFSHYIDQIVDLFTTGAFVRVYYKFCFFEIHGTSFATSLVAGKAAIHFAQGREATDVLCLLRSQMVPFEEGAYSIYGIVDVNGKTNACKERVGLNIFGKALTADPTDLLSVSPNPFQGRLRINLETMRDEVPMNVRILNSLGQQVFSRQYQPGTTELDLNDLQAGVYWLTVAAGEERQTRKIVKQ
ncbi:MAG: S8 family serine peptidase [Bacteroidota bacterium]